MKVAEPQLHRTIFFRLLAFLKPYRKGVFASIVLAVGSQAAQIALVWVTGKGVIDDALLQHRHGLLWLLVGVIVALGAVRAVLMLGRRILSGRQALDVEIDLRSRLYAHLVRLSFGSLRHAAGQLMSRATRSDLQGVRFFLGYGLIFFFQNVLTVLSVTAVLFFFQWQLALIVLAITPVLIVLAYRYSHIAHPVREVQQRLADVGRSRGGETSASTSSRRSRRSRPRRQSFLRRSEALSSRRSVRTGNAQPRAANFLLPAARARADCWSAPHGEPARSAPAASSRSTSIWRCW